MNRKKATKSKRTVVAVILCLLSVFLLFTFIRHRLMLRSEEEILKPIGQMIDVDCHEMCVYVEGSGDKTLVFMSASGTICPILDFRSIYPLLTDEYRIVVVEKFGYGFSDQVDRPRDVASLLADTRAALANAGVQGPFVLCPHSYSGIEALYWAQNYPDEVEAIIGLDMAVPECYEYTPDGRFAVPYYGFFHMILDLGIGRYVPDDVFLPSGDFLTEEENRIYVALGNRNYRNIDLAREGEEAKSNALIVAAGGVPDVPMLFFVSDGTGTPASDEWRRIIHDYADNIPDAGVIELDCPHFVHHYEAERISEIIDGYLQNGYSSE